MLDACVMVVMKIIRNVSFNENLKDNETLFQFIKSHLMKLVCIEISIVHMRRIHKIMCECSVIR